MVLLPVLLRGWYEALPLSRDAVLCREPDPALPLDEPGLSRPGDCTKKLGHFRPDSPTTYLGHVDALVLLQTELVVVVNGRFVGEHRAGGRLPREGEARGRVHGARGLARAAADGAAIVRVVICKGF